MRTMASQARRRVPPTGWGRTTRSHSRVTGPVGRDELRKLIASRPEGGVLARGGGCSYGDAGQNGQGYVLCPVTESRVDVDAVRGTVTATASATFTQILGQVGPAGFVLPVLPGTRHLTLGGAIAADVHGGNHRRDGSISAWIDQIELVDGTGELCRLTPATDPEGVRATVGGMGLTGIIVSATLRLQRIETAGIHVISLRAGSLCEVLSRLETAPTKYSVAWVDATASGSSLGRGIVDLAEHATASQLAAGPPGPPGRTGTGFRPGWSGPVSWPPRSIVTPLTARAVSTAWFRRAPYEEVGLVDLGTYFHRLDAVGGWAKVAGPEGIVRYQFAVPDKAEYLIEEVLDALRRSGCALFPGTIRRFGPATGGELSFPLPGWCLAVDIPAGRAQAAVLDGLDLRIAKAGGRVYLAADERLGRDAFEAMYGPLESWRAARARLDPYGVFRSDLGRRVGLC